MKCPSCMHETLKSFPKLNLMADAKDVKTVLKHQDLRKDEGELFVCPNCQTVIFNKNK